MDKISKADAAGCELEGVVRKYGKIARCRGVVPHG